VHYLYNPIRASVILVLLIALNFGHPLYHQFEGGAFDSILAQINAFAAKLSQE